MRFSRQSAVLLAMLMGYSQFKLFAQSQPVVAVPPTFEVASIRQSGAQSIRGEEGGPGSKSPTLYRYEKATLLDLIARAWNVDGFQISSSAPLDHQNFDLSARIPEGAAKEQFRTMLQDLLAERFGLKTHIESREFPAYELVVAKSGLKLKEAVPGESAPPTPKVTSGPDWPDLPPNRPTITATVFSSGDYQMARLRMQLEPLSMLSRFLPKEDRLPIVDRTGLTGKYSFALEYSQNILGGQSDDLPPAPDLFTALKEQLGLELVRKKLPFNIVVVESFNKLPSEN
jgi:uncharacterized protein (TIGR03435 family)